MEARQDASRMRLSSPSFYRLGAMGTLYCYTLTTPPPFFAILERSRHARCCSTLGRQSRCHSAAGPPLNLPTSTRTAISSRPGPSVHCSRLRRLRQGGIRSRKCFHGVAALLGVTRKALADARAVVADATPGAIAALVVALEVERIALGRALDKRAVAAAVTRVAFAAVVETRIPCERVAGTTIDGKLDVGLADAVA